MFTVLIIMQIIKERFIMKNIPLTHYFEFDGLDAKYRNIFWHELADNGVENVVLSDYMLKTVWDAIDPFSLLKVYKKEVAEKGLRFMDCHSPFGPKIDLNCPVEELRSNLIGIHKQSIVCCSECEIDTITIHSGNPRYPGVSLQQYREFICRSLEELLPFAAKYGVTINIENIWFPTNTPEELIYYINYFKSSNLGFCYDAGHANLMSHPSDNPENPVNVGWNLLNMKPVWDDKVLEKMLPYIVTCHLHDNDGSRDMHLVPCFGDINWEKIMGLLAKAPNLRCIQNEVILSKSNASVAKMCKNFDKIMTYFK